MVRPVQLGNLTDNNAQEQVTDNNAQEQQLCILPQVQFIRHFVYVVLYKL